MSEIQDLRNVANYLETQCKKLRAEMTVLRADNERQAQRMAALDADNARLRAELRRLGLQFDDHDLNRRT